MKYVVVDDRDDIYTTECETLEEAITEAEYQFNHLTDREKKRINAFYVLESANPDEEAENHLDGDVVKEYI